MLVRPQWKVLWRGCENPVFGISAYPPRPWKDLNNVGNVSWRMMVGSSGKSRSSDSSIGQPEALGEGSLQTSTYLVYFGREGPQWLGITEGDGGQTDSQTQLLSLPTAVAIIAPISSLCPSSFPVDILTPLVLQNETCVQITLKFHP